MIYLKLRQALALGILSALFVFNVNGATPASITVAWDPSAESDAVGYRVRYGTASGNYQTTVEAGANVMVPVNGLVEGNTYYFIVTAYNEQGIESLPSDEISHTLTTIPPFQIVNQPTSQVVASGSAITLNIGVTSSGGTLSYQWHKDGVVIPGAVGSTYLIENINATTAGAYSVTVSDGNTTYSSPPASISGVEMQLIKTLVLNGVPGSSYAISYRENLIGSTWSLLTNIVLTSSPLYWMDSSATNANQRFYQVTPAE